MKKYKYARKLKIEFNFLLKNHNIYNPIIYATHLRKLFFKKTGLFPEEIE